MDVSENTEISKAPTPKLGLGSLVAHPLFGTGKIMAYEKDDYVVLFKTDVKRVAYTFDAMRPTHPYGDPETDRIRQAVREVLGDYGWIDIDLEMGKRWVGGTLRMLPGKEETQSRDVPIEAFFKKLIGIRDRLRVLEQKINQHPSLPAEDKVELEGYITRCYGSLTTFNLLFSEKESQFKGTGE